MHKLTIFDDGERVAIISLIENTSFLFARTPREWREMKRLMDSTPEGENYLERVAAKAHSYNYSTELLKDNNG